VFDRPNAGEPSPFVFVSDDGRDCSSRSYFDLEPPIRIVVDVVVRRWPGVEAVGTVDLPEGGG